MTAWLLVGLERKSRPHRALLIVAGSTRLLQTFERDVLGVPVRCTGPASCRLLQRILRDPDGHEVEAVRHHPV